MFDYIIDNITNTQFKKEFNTKFISLENFFSDEHLKRLTDDVYNSKHLTKDEWPPEESAPSVISFADMMDNDPSGFYESIIDYFHSEEVKSSILKKFGITENLKKIQERTATNVSFHTEYPNQFDGTHTDQKDNLFTISLQIYLPNNEDLKDYGTQFYNNDRDVCYETDFLPNTGYCFLANNNSWHCAKVGAERKSFFVRYSYKMAIENTQTIFNYNPQNKICHVIWNKEMDVHVSHTDWMAYATLQNITNLGIENIAYTSEPFKRDIAVLRDLKNQGFETAIIYFGGFIWNDTNFFDYMNNHDFKEIIIGGLKENNTEFLRQCFAINLKRLDEVYETHARGKFFEEVIANKDDYINLSKQIVSSRSYYHPEEEDAGDVADFITPDIKRPLSDFRKEFIEDIGYLANYREDYSNILKNIKNIRQF